MWHRRSNIAQIMKEESDTSASNDLLERLASHPHPLLSLTNNLCNIKHLQQQSPAVLSTALQQQPINIKSSPTSSGSSSPSPVSISSVTSISKVSSSTNGNGTNTPALVVAPRSSCTNSLSSNQQIGSSIVTPATILQSKATLDKIAQICNPLSFSTMMTNSEHSRLISSSDHNRIFQELVAVLSSANSTRSKSSSSDSSNAGSPLSSISLSVNTKPGVKPRSSDSPGSGSLPTGTREKVFVCQICNRSFGYKHVLQNHERTHTGEKPFECRECHKRFTRDHHLKTHMRLHTGEKPYHCTHCDRQFVQVANLRRHLRVHTGERPYACELCTSKFSDSNQLKAHMLIHKGEKPFECNKCMGRFRRRHHLMHHKCPKDEANVGRPRRGRRPRAYDQLQPASPNSLSSSRPASADELFAQLPLMAAVTSTTSNNSPMTNSNYNYNRHQMTSSKQISSHNHHNNTHAHHNQHHHHNAHHHHHQTLPLLGGPPPLHPHPLSPAGAAPASSLPPAAHHFTKRDQHSPPKSRRKPRHTIRILPQHTSISSDIFHDDDDDELQPLNLTTRQLSTHLGLKSRRAYNTNNNDNNTNDNFNNNDGEDVLDLSRSRSDAEESEEPEPIEEDDEDEDEELEADHLSLSLKKPNIIDNNNRHRLLIQSNLLGHNQIEKDNDEEDDIKIENGSLTKRILSGHPYSLKHHINKRYHQMNDNNGNGLSDRKLSTTTSTISSKMFDNRLIQLKKHQIQKSNGVTTVPMIRIDDEDENDNEDQHDVEPSNKNEDNDNDVLIRAIQQTETTTASF